jgi:hypothetical protein
MKLLQMVWMSLILMKKRMMKLSLTEIGLDNEDGDGVIISILRVLRRFVPCS